MIHQIKITGRNLMHEKFNQPSPEIIQAMKAFPTIGTASFTHGINSDGTEYFIFDRDRGEKVVEVSKDEV